MLHIIYRSVDAANRKPRPAGFSKLACLVSFMAACAACPELGELLFLNNGPIAPELMALMSPAGQVVEREGLELHESYWAAIDLALGSGWADDDLVYFGEDDYLYRPEAFAGIAAAAALVPEASYLAPYATIGQTMPNGERLHDGLRRPRVSAEPVAEAGGVSWHRALSHTSSFAVRVGALRADRALHRLAPRCGGAWDHSLALAYQGVLPYGPRRLVTGTPEGRWAKTVVWRGALSAQAARRRGRMLIAPRPALATHMEIGLLAAGTDWGAGG